MGKGVHLDPDPIQPTKSDWNRPTYDRPVSSGVRQRVTNPIIWVRLVGGSVLSSKTRLNPLDQRLTKIQQFKLFPESFWSNYFRSNEIYVGFDEISAGSSEFSPGWTWPEPTTSWCRPDRFNPTLSPVGRGLNFLHPILSSWLRVGHKIDLYWPVDTPKNGGYGGCKAF